MNTFHQRLQTGGVAWETALDHPVFGVGYSGFRLVARNYGADTAFSTFWSPVFISTAGNQYLQVLTDGGIVALIAFITFILVCLRAFKETMEFTTDERIHAFLGAGYVWLFALVLGNQSAAWMLPGSLISYLLWINLSVVIAARWIFSRSSPHIVVRPALVANRIESPTPT